MSRVSWLLIAAGLVPAAFLVAFLSGAFKGLTDEVASVVTWISALSLSTIVYSLLLWKLVPNFLKKLIARLIRLLPNVPNYLKRRAITNEVEGFINKALGQFSREGAGFIDHEIRISWLSPDDNASTRFFESDKVFVKLDYSRSLDINIVEALLRYCKQTLLRNTREYANRPLMRAIDLQFVDEILRREGTSDGRSYFVQDVIERETQNSSETLRFFDKLEVLSQHGLFSRIFLPELHDYPTVAMRGWSRARHQQNLEGLLDFLEGTVRHRESGTRAFLEHIHEGVRVAIVLVGIPDKLHFQGTKPYVRRIAINEQRGARTVYLIGYNEGTRYIEGIAKEARLRGLVESYTIELYDALVRDEVQRHRLARLTMRSGEGSQFLAEYPDTDEWPDLVEEYQVAQSSG